MASEEQQARWKDSTAGIVKYLPRSDGTDDVILADAGYLNTLESDKATAVKALQQIHDRETMPAFEYSVKWGEVPVSAKSLAQAALDALGTGR